MQGDLLVRGGWVVDGTGRPGRFADLLIAAGRIEAVVAPGAAPAGVRHEIDATGCVVTPGFIDPHTHLDAQLFWDPSGWPSVGHGVTTVVIGNCGFGVAPCSEGGADDLLRSLEATEEIPFTSTKAAVPMKWRRWSDFLEAVSSLNLGINVAGLVPHSALRIAAMGGRASSQRATAEDLGSEITELRDALGAGALGLSTSRGPNHHDGDGRPVASRAADDVELAALVRECAERVWQINVATKGVSGPAGADLVNTEVDRYAMMSRSAGARLTWTPLVVTPHDTEAAPLILRHMHELNRHSPVAAQVAPQAMTGSIAFDGPSFAGMIEGWQSAWSGFARASLSERIAVLQSPSVRAQLRDAPQDCRRVTSPCYERWTIVASPSRPETAGMNLAELAAREGHHPIDVLFELALADGLATTLQVGLSNLDHEQVTALVKDPIALIGLGDAGAHVRSITNYCYPTFVLSKLVRDEKHLTLEEGVARMTRHPAEFFGLAGRGTLEQGGYGDLCVFDLAALSLQSPRLVSDLPGGARRVQRGATGFRAVIVNGVPVLLNDELTGAHPGQVVRR